MGGGPIGGGPIEAGGPTAGGAIGIADALTPGASGGLNKVTGAGRSPAVKGVTPSASSQLAAFLSSNFVTIVLCIYKFAH